MPNHPRTGDTRSKDTAFPLIVGTLGWKRDSWLGHYYPPDLPDEWQLAFYANDFSGVLIPAIEWQAADNRQWRQWREETPGQFAMLIEAAPGTVPDRSRIDSLGSRFAGIVNMAGRPRPGLLQSAALDNAVQGEGEVILLTARDLSDTRRLGQQLIALVSHRTPVQALIVTGEVDASAVQDLRVLAELTGLA